MGRKEDPYGTTESAGDPGRFAGPASGWGRRGGQPVFTGIGLEIFELQFQLIEQTAAALGAGTELLAPQTGNLQLQMRDQRLGHTLPGTRIRQSGLGFIGPAGHRKHQRFQRLDVVRKSGSGGFHAPERITETP